MLQLCRHTTGYIYREYIVGTFAKNTKTFTRSQDTWGRWDMFAQDTSDIVQDI